MDNTQGLGAAMQESWQRDQAKSQEKRIKELERQIQSLEENLLRLNTMRREGRAMTDDEFLDLRDKFRHYNARVFCGETPFSLDLKTFAEFIVRLSASDCGEAL